MCLSGKPCSQEQAQHEGVAVSEVELWACPCLLCGLLHSAAFRAEGFFELCRKSSPFSPHRYFRGSLPLPAERRFADGPADTDGAVCSRAACHGAQSHGHGPALARWLPAWLCVPRAAWKAQLRASHGMEALGVLPPPSGASLWAPLRVLGENESRVLKLPFSGEGFQLCPLPGLAAASPGAGLVWQPWLAAGCASAARRVTGLELLLARLCLCRAYVQMMWAYLNLFKEEQQTHKIRCQP